MEKEKMLRAAAFGSMKPGIIGSAESTTGLYSEICSTSETNNTMRESEERFTSRNGGKTETRSLNSAQSSHGAPGFPKHDISIQETPNRRDEEMDHSLSKNDTGLALDAAGKGDILANMPISLRRVSIWCGKKKLLVLDLNGLLVDVVNEPHNSQRAFIKVARKSVFKRPFCDEFLKFCFQRFDIGIWSSRVKKNIDVMVDFLFGEQRKVLLFCWDLSKCTSTGFKTMENAHKPLVLKELKRLWNREDPHLPWEAGRYSPPTPCSSTTPLTKPSPHTAIFPTPYDYRNVDDTSLGPGGDLRDYLEGLAAAEDVQSYVAWRPFGQPPILPGCPSWSFYLRIIERMGASLFCSAARA
ncbi:unnamed protein product [Spirodela intermedia]|uniref:Mitochondrial import inner membrane translocase subunit TIM50 n=1 Tax=Spirodela intermedia TaxID=51605 RepID=A0A7I8IYH5_SPIIN|nr:unnamed protein product [Spirodela intermedia]CAA6662918.1 unnamed protein product [Spirodela intermedia]